MKPEVLHRTGMMDHFAYDKLLEKSFYCESQLHTLNQWGDTDMEENGKNTEANLTASGCNL